MRSLLLFLFTVTSFGLFSQTITVEGSALKVLDSDEIVIRTGIYDEGENLDELYKGVRDKMSLIIKTLSEDDDFCEIQTELIRVEPDRYRHNDDKTKFVIQQNISLRLKKIEKYDEVVMKLMKLGVNQLNDVKFTSSKANDFKDELRIEALKAAKEKAVKMAEALGQEVGEPIDIVETRIPMVGYNSNTILYETSVKSNGGPSIAPAKAEISAKVRVTFKIKPKN